MVEHIIQTYIHKSKYDYRLFCSSLYGCVLRFNINQYNLSSNGIEHNREPHRLKKNNKMYLEFFYSGIDNSTPIWGSNNREHIIRVVFSLLHKNRKTKMLHKASKQAIYNSIYEEGIYNPLIIKNNNNININYEGE